MHEPMFVWIKGETFRVEGPQMPTLDPQNPLCTGCFGETWHDGDSLRCDDCGVHWPGGEDYPAEVMDA